MTAGIRPDRVAIYIRWSTEDQGEGTTLAVQREACEAYLRSQGWQLRPELLFVDDGYSGGSLHRPALARLRRAVQARQIDCVVCFKLDRLSRSVVDTVKLVLEEWEGLCHVRSAREAIDTAGQAGRLFFYQLAQYAEWEREVIRDRTYSGKLRRAAEGGHLGPPAFGYRLIPDPQHPRRSLRVIDEAEAAAVRTAFRLAALGVGRYSIARQLNAAGCRTRRGRPWTPALIGHLLRNPLYKGEVVYQRRQVNPHHRRRPEEPARLLNPRPLVVRVDRLALVPPALWQAAQGRATGAPEGQAVQGRDTVPAAGLRPSREVRFLLGGLLPSPCRRPGGAPLPLVGEVSAGRRRYRCFGYHEGPHRGCLVRTLDAEPLEHRIAERFLACYGGPGCWQSLQRLAAAEAAAGGADLAARRRACGEQLQRSQTQAARLEQDYLDGRLPADEYQRLRQRVRAEAAAAQAELAQLAMQAAATPGAAARLAALDAAGAWQALTVAQRNQLLRLLIDSIRLERHGQELLLEICWKVAAAPERP